MRICLWNIWCGRGLLTDSNQGNETGANPLRSSLGASSAMKAACPRPTLVQHWLQPCRYSVLPSACPICSQKDSKGLAIVRASSSQGAMHAVTASSLSWCTAEYLGCQVFDFAADALALFGLCKVGSAKDDQLITPLHQLNLLSSDNMMPCGQAVLLIHLSANYVTVTKQTTNGDTSECLQTQPRCTSLCSKETEAQRKPHLTLHVLQNTLDGRHQAKLQSSGHSTFWLCDLCLSALSIQDSTKLYGLHEKESQERFGPCITKLKLDLKFPSSLHERRSSVGACQVNFALCTSGLANIQGLATR